MPSVKSIYTDGACSGNPGPGGWGVVVYFDDGTCHELGGAAAETTNNRMELQAAIASLEYLRTLSPSGTIPLYTDSEYVKKGVTQWVAGWKRKGWKTAKGSPVLNKDLWEILDQLNSDTVEWRYVKGHSGDIGNDRCDEIARGFSLGNPPGLCSGGTPSESARTESTATVTTVVAQTAGSHPPSSEQQMQTLNRSLQVLRLADEIATQGYLISIEELAALLSLSVAEIQQQTQPWTWRNWLICPNFDQEDLWQLTRTDH
ncbi:MAG: ribonuclease HI [Cyanobacteria bacterium P01_A01_bin.17]